MPKRLPRRGPGDPPGHLAPSRAVEARDQVRRSATSRWSLILQRPCALEFWMRRLAILLEERAPGRVERHVAGDDLLVGQTGSRGTRSTAADHLVHRPKPRRAMCSRTSSSDQAHEVDDVLRVAREPLAQFRVLRGHAHRAGVEVAGPHHHAAEGHEGRRGEAELLAPSSAPTTTSRPVLSWPSTSTTIRLRRSFISNLVRLGEPELQGMPACLIEVRGDAPVPRRVRR